jgi:AcrR family transcriptional regulator
MAYPKEGIMTAPKKAGRKPTSRDRLMEAARRLSAAGRYFGCSVEDVANEAGVSRAGFYTHFSSKEDLLGHIIEDQVEWYVRQFRIFPARELWTRSGLHAWIDTFIERYREINDIMAQFRFDMHVKEAFAQNQAVRLRVMEALGIRVPELQIFLDDGSFNSERQTTLLLWIYQLEQICLNAAFAPQTFPVETAIQKVADQFLSLTGITPID